MSVVRADRTGPTGFDSSEWNSAAKRVMPPFHAFLEHHVGLVQADLGAGLRSVVDLHHEDGPPGAHDLHRQAGKRGGGGRGWRGHVRRGAVGTEGARVGGGGRRLGRPRLRGGGGRRRRRPGGGRRRFRPGRGGGGRRRGGRRGGVDGLDAQEICPAGAAGDEDKHGQHGPQRVAMALGLECSHEHGGRYRPGEGKRWTLATLPQPDSWPLYCGKAAAESSRDVHPATRDVSAPPEPAGIASRPAETARSRSSGPTVSPRRSRTGATGRSRPSTTWRCRCGRGRSSGSSGPTAQARRPASEC